MLHIVIVLNVFQPSAVLSGHVESFNDHKNAFLNDPKCQKQGFLDLGWMDRLDIAYNVRTVCFTILGNIARS